MEGSIHTEEQINQRPVLRQFLVGHLGPFQFGPHVLALTVECHCFREAGFVFAERDKAADDHVSIGRLATFIAVDVEKTSTCL